MSTEIIDYSTPEPEKSRMSEAIEQLDLTQQKFFNAASSWVKAPSANHAEEVMKGQMYISKHFREAAQAVLHDELQTDEAKAGSLVTLLSGIENNRIEVFSSLVKKGKFTQEPQDDGFQENLLHAIKEKVNSLTISNQLALQCSGFMRVDVEELFDKAPRARFLKAAKATGWYALDGAKLSAAVVVGTVIAKKITKK